MCDKCIELDRKINRYRQITERVLDPLLAEGVGKLIEEAESRKSSTPPRTTEVRPPQLAASKVKNCAPAMNRAKDALLAGNPASMRDH